MTPLPWLLVFLAAFPWTVSSTCEVAGPGQCVFGVSPEPDMTVYPDSSVSCTFEDSLCSYRQGCVDHPPMQNWTIVNGKANSQQSGSGTCSVSNYYSILESPFLNFTTASCLLFKCDEESPALMEAFLVSNLNETGIFLGHCRDHYITIPSGIWKIQFRANGHGGGSRGVYIQDVSFEAGSCRFSDCKFDNGFCKWAVSGWSSSTSAHRGFAYVNTSNFKATLAAPYARAPEREGDCLHFKYRLVGTGSELTVSVKNLDGTTATVWRLSTADLSASSPQMWKPAVVYITASHAYQVIFSGRIPGSSSVKLSEVSIKYPAGNCQSSPSNALPSTSAKPMVAASTQSAGLPGTDTYVNPSSSSQANYDVTTNEETSKDSLPTTSDNKMAGTDSNTSTSASVIGGTVAAAVFLVAVVVVIIVVFRRRLRRADQNKCTTKDMTSAIRDVNAGHVATAGSSNRLSRGDEIDGNMSLSSVINPYELADDGAPGKTRNSHTDPFTNGASHHNDQQLNGTLDDDYSCIDDTQPTATGAHGKKTTPANSNPRDVYSVVKKPDKKTPTPGYSLAKIVGDKPVLSNPNDVYSVVNKKGKKPNLAPKPGHSDTEYNTISYKGNNATGDKAARGVTSDPYNRIGAVASLGTDGQNRESTIAEEGSLVDDYNTLDFADTRQNEPRKEKSGAARAAYDHVHNDPDDTYNKTRIGKRNVVIGSDYDHVKPSN